MNKNIYLDHAATTPMNEEVIKTMTKAMENHYENPSSIHQLGKKNHVLIEQARERMAESIGAKAEEIVITSGGTESDNMAIIKTAEKYRYRGNHIISTMIEHPAVLNPLKKLEEKDFEVTYLPADKNGQIKLEELKKAIRPDTILISVMYVNNEVGSLQPIKEIGQFLSNEHPEIIFHTDAVQAYGILNIDVEELNVDLLSVSAHKMNGPKGIGFLYIRKGLKLDALLLGGAQENERRGGTENLPAILAFAKAIEINEENKVKQYEKISKLKEYFIKSLEATEINYSINCENKDNAPHILSISFEEIKSELLLIQLDLNNIAVSAGSACTAGSLEDSHVLQSIFGDKAREVKHTIRFSFGASNSYEEIDRVIEKLKKYAK